MHKIWQPKLYNTDGAVIKDKCRIGTIYGTFANLNVGVINSTVELTHDTIVTTHGILPPRVMVHRSRVWIKYQPIKLTKGKRTVSGGCGRACIPGSISKRRVITCL